MSPKRAPNQLNPPHGEKKVLLHSCCAPCSGSVIEDIHQAGIALTIYFYNPNIHPQKEYLIRKEENIRYAKNLGIPFIDADYDTGNWFERTNMLTPKVLKSSRVVSVYLAGRTLIKSRGPVCRPPLYTQMLSIGIITGESKTALNG